MKLKLYIPHWAGILMLVVISIASAGYTYLGDQDGWKPPQTMSWDERITAWPTAIAAQITQERASADLLVFISWFVAHAALLGCLYLVGCYVVSRRGPGGKDL